MAGRIKVLLSKLGLDGHNRGIITVAKALSGAGMEVIYIGNSLPNEIINAAIQEDVDVVGVSSLGGAHLALGLPLIEIAKQEKLLDRVVFLLGGVFPHEDGIKLKEIGFDRIFVPSAGRDAIVKAIKDLVLTKRG